MHFPAFSFAGVFPARAVHSRPRGAHKGVNLINSESPCSLSSYVLSPILKVLCASVEYMFEMSTIGIVNKREFIDSRNSVSGKIGRLLNSISILFCSHAMKLATKDKTQDRKTTTQKRQIGRLVSRKKSNASGFFSFKHEMKAIKDSVNTSARIYNRKETRKQKLHCYYDSFPKI